MSYKDKYEKYKNKYIKLKNNIFGGYYDNSKITFNNEIYCNDKNDRYSDIFPITPHKNKMIEILSILINKIDNEICDKEDENNPKKNNKKLTNLKRIKDNIIKKIEKGDYCIDDLKFEFLNNDYIIEIKKYIKSDNFVKAFKDLAYEIRPINFISDNFYPILETNFNIYFTKTFEISQHIFPIYTHNSENIENPKNYLLTPEYDLIEYNFVDDYIRQPLNNNICYPLFTEEYNYRDDELPYARDKDNICNTETGDNLTLINSCDSLEKNDTKIPYIYDKKRLLVEGMILMNDNNKFINIIKMFYLNIKKEFKTWIRKFITFKMKTSILLYNDSFIVMDAFIISNTYHVYLNKLYMKVGYLDLKLKKTSFKKDLSNKEYNIINEYKSNDELLQIIIDTIRPIEDILVNTYNCCKINYLMLRVLRTLSEDDYREKIENLNIYLKYTKNQILTALIEELYNELYDFNELKSKTLYFDLLCILNSIYYYRIYNLPFIKNLINYQVQFSVNKLEECYIKDEFKDYNEDIINDYDFFDSTIHNATHILKIYYNEYINTNKIPGYINFLYTDLNFKINIIKPDKSVSINHSLCGENTIINLLNLLILNKDTEELDYRLLPETTIPELVEFYKKYNTINLFKNKDVIEEYVAILSHIKFKIIFNKDGTIDTKYDIYTHYTEKDGTMIDGVEITPSYMNICRMFIYLFGLDIDIQDINEDTLKNIFKIIKDSYYAQEMAEKYIYSSDNDSVKITLDYLGTINMHSDHSLYNINSDTNIVNILEYLNLYSGTINETTHEIFNLIDDKKNSKLPLHYGYCGIIYSNYIYQYFFHTLLNIDSMMDFLLKIVEYYDVAFKDLIEILILIYDKNYELYKKITSITHKNMFYYIANYADNTDVDLIDFINLYLRDYYRTKDNFIDTITTNNELILLIEYIRNMESDEIQKYIPDGMLYTIFDKDISPEFLYSSILFNKFNLFLHNLKKEQILNCFINNYNFNFLIKEDDCQLITKFPELLNDVIINDKINYKSEIITILIEHYHYDIDDINLYDFNILMNILNLHLSYSIKLKINEKYIDLLLDPTINNPDIIKNIREIIMAILHSNNLIEMINEKDKAIIHKILENIKNYGIELPNTLSYQFKI